MVKIKIIGDTEFNPTNYSIEDTDEGKLLVIVDGNDILLAIDDLLANNPRYGYFFFKDEYAFLQVF